MCCSFALFSWKSDSSSVQKDNDNHFAKKQKNVEKACTIQGKIGTMCEFAQGDCKKTKSCEAITVISHRQLTPEEIEYYATAYAQYMLDEEYIDASTYFDSKNFAIELLQTIE